MPLTAYAPVRYVKFGKVRSASAGPAIVAAATAPNNTFLNFIFSSVKFTL